MLPRRASAETERQIRTRNKPFISVPTKEIALNTQTVETLGVNAPLAPISEYPVLLYHGDKNAPAGNEAYFPTSERVRQEISCVLQKELSPDLLQWVGKYECVGRRNSYLWKWCHQGVELTTLSCVQPELRDHLYDTKVLGVMLDVLLDDIADQQGDPSFLEYLLRIPFGPAETAAFELTPSQQAYAQLTAEVWNEIESRVRKFPHFKEYADLWRYDYLQLLNTMRYSHLLNGDLALLNLVEHDLYSPHNMHMMVSATMDLMCSPQFDRMELGLLREAVWHSQYMGRIGNLVTTWQREIGERDFSSGVFASAVSRGDLTVTDLLEGDRNRIEAGVRAGDHEGYFLRQWRKRRLAILALSKRLQSVQLQQLATGLERLVCLHLGSRGYK
jgi:hypothetical protein